MLALQETTDAFVDELNKAGIGDLLPYAQVASSDGVYGNRSIADCDRPPAGFAGCRLPFQLESVQ